MSTQHAGRWTIPRPKPLWPVVITVVMLIAAQQPPLASIRGVVLDPEGAPLPGARVHALPTVDRPGTLDFTKADGSYDLPVRPGTYTLSVEAPGFCTPPRALVVANDNEPTRVDLTLHLAAPDIVDKVLLSLPELVALADAVVYLKVARSHPARLMIPNVECGDGNVVTEHESDVLLELKVDTALWQPVRRLRFIQRRAGTFLVPRRTANPRESRFVRGPVAPFEIGQEFVAFLGWVDDHPYLEPHWDPFEMVPVRDGVVAWQDRRPIPGAPDGMLLDELLESLRSVVQERRVEDTQP